MAGWLGLPVAASAQAAPLDRITMLVHLLMAVVFALSMLRVLIRSCT